MSGTGVCKSCGKTVVWVKTVTGKNMPLDPHSTLDGNVDVVGGVGHVVKKSEIGKELRHQSHFVSCVNAAQHRKKKR